MSEVHTQASGALFPLTRRDLTAYSIVFLAYFLSAIASMWLYYSFRTSPALIWPPIGIALIAMLYGGYRMWIPIFLAQFLAAASRSAIALDVVLVISIGFTIQAIAGLWILRRIGFEPAIDKLRNVLLLVFATGLACVVEPAIVTTYQYLNGGLTLPALVNFGRTWGAGVFSILVIVPLILQWYPWPKLNEGRMRMMELIAAFLLLTANNILVFWTTYPQYFGIAVIFFLPAVLIWFALRFHPRWLAAAVFHTAVIGIAGTLLANPSGFAISTQLIAVVVYVGLIAAIFYVFATVVEERRRAYRQLEEAYESTFAADQAKSEFIAILAHELRNPLAPIVSSLELLKLMPQTEEAMRTIESAQEHSAMIRRLLDDLLDTARLSQNKFKLQQETIRIGDLVEQSVASTSQDFSSRDHTLSVAVSDPQMQLHADPVRIKQILINLLTNAARYTPHGGRIELSCIRAKDKVVLRVRDNGVGIREEHRISIFEPFKQVQEGARTSAGLGIGLFISRRLAEMHGGTLEVESTGDAKGSTFTLTLPLPDQLPLPSLDKQRTQIASQSSAKILVVDDNESAASALKKLLQHYGHSVETANSGNKAIQKTDSFKPDMILLDIGMPDIDGYEVARRLRASKWNGTIVALTGYGQESDKQQAREAGFDNHLVKPVSVADVMGILAGHTESTLARPERVL